jgi:hypothetical protein
MRGLAEIWEKMETLPFHRDREALLADFFRGLGEDELRRVGAWLVGDERLPALLPGSELLRLASSASQLPVWLLQESAAHVDSAGEAVALVLPEPASPADWDWETYGLTREEIFARAWASPTLVARWLAGVADAGHEAA